MMVSATTGVWPFLLLTGLAGAVDLKEHERFLHLKNWLGDLDGVAHDALVLGETAWGGRGLFVNKAVAEHEVLVGVPFGEIIGHDFREDPCKMIKAFEWELKLGEGSQLDVYLEMDDSLNSPLPGLWPKETVRLLQGVPPAHPNGHFRWYLEGCLGKRPSDSSKAFDELPVEERQAVLAYVTRSADIGFLPIYDLANHDNGNLNTYMEIDAENEMAFMKARRGLEPGQQVTNSYGHTSTPNIFYTYGFLEPYPRVWEIEGQESQYLVALLSQEGPVLLEDTSVGIILQDVLNPLDGTLAGKIEAADKAFQKHSTKFLQQVLGATSNMQNHFPTTIKQDQEQLSALQGHEKIAVEYRLEYKKAVHFIAEALEIEIQARSSEWHSEL